MAHNLEVIAPENLIDPAILLLTIGLPQLCVIVLRGAIGALARPAKLGKPFYRWSLFNSKVSCSSIVVVLHFIVSCVISVFRGYSCNFCGSDRNELLFLI